MAGEPELYFRRSRTGCLTCRAIRVKCDEKRPQCQNCHDRGVACDGFNKQLRWVSVGFESHAVSPHSTPRSTTTMAAAASVKDLVPAGFPLQLALGSRLALASPRDAYLLSHWAETFIGLVFPNPYIASDFRAANFSMFMDGDSALLRTSLASSAAHLAAIGSISEAEALESQHIALRTVNTSIRCSKPTLGQGGRPVYLSDDCISASQNLAGMAVIQGYDFSKVLLHVQGCVSILYARCEWDRIAGQSDSLVKSPILYPTIKFLVYFDVFCTVPSPRRPLLTRAFWEEHIFPGLDQNMAFSRRPDVVHGYASEIFCILGESSGLICDLFEGRIDDDTFFNHREVILQDLRCAMHRIPAARFHAEAPAGTRFHDESWETKNDNACIAAAISHGLATEIFLHRAHASNQAILARLSARLYDAVLGVPLDSSYMTLMAWPLFVLGCESVSASTRATQVAQLLQGMVKKMNILNISRCFDVLRHVIWPLAGHMQRKEAKLEAGGSHHSPGRRVTRGPEKDTGLNRGIKMQDDAIVASVHKDSFWIGTAVRGNTPHLLRPIMPIHMISRLPTTFDRNLT
ncbi:hypothetical protein B0J13DRAFT_532211 [Dactylonectria estremocensis]|uniref:Zn(2)-C6 fungal-type domain-containing protein n=1 Tax=Dactylonectria estremocensis TaxID=1079267 RepID=A0A9P9IFT6_9HYPO|nr:hypothetical protein B0J13DRAFT_532211 [Dactylonectria estremocensis]